MQGITGHIRKLDILALEATCTLAEKTRTQQMSLDNKEI